MESEIPALFWADEIKELCEKLAPDDLLTLVHDNGIYIMSFAQPVGERDICYAFFCDPDDPLDKETWIDNESRFIPTGDDFGDAFMSAKDWLAEFKESQDMASGKLVVGFNAYISQEDDYDSMVSATSFSSTSQKTCTPAGYRASLSRKYCL